MRKPPDLTEAAIAETLASNYGLQIADLAFLPLGADASSLVYRVRSARGERLIFKARKRAWFSPASLLVPGELRRAGIPGIVAALPTLSQGLWVDDNEWVWSLYPFIEGGRAVETGLTGPQWRRLGDTIRQVHAARLDAAVSKVLPREGYLPSRFDLLPRLAAASQQPPEDRVQQELAALWRSRQEAISALTERCERLARDLRRAGLPFVLCHADLHVWNLLVDAAGEVWIVDWDEVCLAPRERDLMFFVGSIGPGLVKPQETGQFLGGYGQAAIDMRALAYYRLAWALQDLAAYGESVCFTPDLDEATRRAALESIIGMFAPGNIVDMALATDSRAA